MGEGAVKLSNFFWPRLYKRILIIRTFLQLQDTLDFFGPNSPSPPRQAIPFTAWNRVNTLFYFQEPHQSISVVDTHSTLILNWRNINKITRKTNEKPSIWLRTYWNPVPERMSGLPNDRTEPNVIYISSVMNQINKPQSL